MNRDKWIITFNNMPVEFSDKLFEIKMGTLERKRHNREFAKRKRAMRGNITLTFEDNVDKKWNTARMLYDYWRKRNK